MDSCSVYHLESETGEFLSWVTHLDDLDMLLDYQDRFVNVAGEMITCFACSAINVDSISLSDDCLFPVQCFADPCEMTDCPGYPELECISNFCGGCWADYYYEGEWLPCETTPNCFDLTGIDFGDCDMPLGVGFINDSCEYISGCDWVVDSVDYSNAFFETMEACEAACFSTSVDPLGSVPSKFELFQNYPNPFNPTTTIRFNIGLETRSLSASPSETEYRREVEMRVSLRIFDINGRVVDVLVNGELPARQGGVAGEHELQWDASHLPTGIYFYQLQTKHFSETKKLILLK